MGLLHRFKVIIINLESFVFQGILKKRIDNVKRNHGEFLYNVRSLYNRRFANHRHNRLICKQKISTKDLILSQYHDDNFDKYMHYDGAVRLFAIEEYYEQNDFGFDLYRRMQAKSGFDWTKRFKKLIRTVEKEGFNTDEYVEVDRQFNIMDGSHRLMLAYYHNIEFINVKIYKQTRIRSFNLGFFWANSFSYDECRLISEKTNKILDNCLYDFVGIVWPPAFSLSDELIREINQFDPDNIQIFESNNMILSRNDYLKIFHAMYHTDILDEKGVDDKIKLLDNYLFNAKTYSIKIFKLHVKNPHMGVNTKNYNSQSLVVKEIKTVFRERYSKYIANYKYDVIMHISDNYLQSKFCTLIFDMDYSIGLLFDDICKSGGIIERKISNEREIIDNEACIDFKYSLGDIFMVMTDDIYLHKDIILKYCKERFIDSWYMIDEGYLSTSMFVKVSLMNFSIINFFINRE